MALLICMTQACTCTWSGSCHRRDIPVQSVYARVQLVPAKKQVAALSESRVPGLVTRGIGKQASAMGRTPPTELNDAEDFRIISNEQNQISICGFGSLLSETSARYTFPDLLNFRQAILPGFRRIFAHTTPLFIERGIANIDTKEVSSLSVEPSADDFLIVTVFEISIDEAPAFIEREHEFRFIVVVPQYPDDRPSTKPAVCCCKFTDEEYFQKRCKGSITEYNKRYGRYNIDKIWRDDILPCRVYLRHCVLAAGNLGQDAYDNFLDHTYLGNRKTTIRQHLKDNPEIMEEEPPHSLKERYGG